MTSFDLDFDLRQGATWLRVAASCRARVLALYGPSGSGKTSILDVMAGVRRPARGRVVLNGQALFDSAARVNVPSRARGVGYVPQDALLFPHLDVRANVLYGAPDGLSDDLGAMATALEIDRMLSRPVATLSGGERQRVALLRAIASRPRLLLLDEPLSALDGDMKRRVLDLLVSLRDLRGVPMVYVTHARDEALMVADYAVVLRDGVVVTAGPAAQAIAS